MKATCDTQGQGMADWANIAGICGHRFAQLRIVLPDFRKNAQ
jgi:hypothetical protein